MALIIYRFLLPITLLLLSQKVSQNFQFGKNSYQPIIIVIILILPGHGAPLYACYHSHRRRQSGRFQQSHK